MRVPVPCCRGAEGQEKGKRAAVLRTTLLALSKVFTLAVKARLFLYNVRILRDSTLGVQVIAVGNITVGGTGKTPVVEKFARELTDAGRKVAILSRGYKSKAPPFWRKGWFALTHAAGHQPQAVRQLQQGEIAKCRRVAKVSQSIFIGAIAQSSITSSWGLAIRPRPIDTMACSPPDMVPASWEARSLRRGNTSYTRSMRRRSWLASTSR